MIYYSTYTYKNLKGCDLRSKSSNIQKQKVTIKKIKSGYLHKWDICRWDMESINVMNPGIRK